jgi:hypothetical protein
MKLYVKLPFGVPCGAGVLHPAANCGAVSHVRMGLGTASPDEQNIAPGVLFPTVKLPLVKVPSVNR